MKQKEVEEEIFADAQVPRNDAQECGQTLTNIYGALQGCRDSFVAVVPMFREIQDFNQNILKVIRFSLPNELKRVDTETAKMLADDKVTDEAYALELARVCNAKHNVARLGILAQIAYNLNTALASLESKYKKLSERIHLQSNGSAEWQLAVRMRVAVRDGIAVLNSRRADIATRFFKVRRAAMEEILKASRTLDRQYAKRNGEKGQREEEYVSIMMKEGDASVLDDIMRIRESAVKANALKV